MASPEDRKYSETHEWHLVEGDTLTLGITQFAVDQLTDLTYVEMKPAGTTIGAGDSIGEVESVKTTSDVYSAAGGEIVEVNPKLEEDPGVVNRDPYGEGWLVKIRVTDDSGLEKLMDAKRYDEQAS